MRHSITALSLAGLLSCAGGANRPVMPFTGKLPFNTELELDGSFTFAPDGELRLALTSPCRVLGRGSTKTDFSGAVVAGGAPAECDDAHLRVIRVVAVTPWQTEVPGVWLDASHLAFRLDWKQSGLDPLADDAVAVSAKPWVLASSDARWRPTSAEASRILKLISDTTQTEVELVSGGAAPSLEVAAFEVEQGKLVAGREANLVVRIANRGPGTAYRVAATMRSSVASLHGQRLSFGMIKPGAEKTRTLRVKLPVSESSTDTMLVLVLGEGNGFTPPNVSRRVPIAVTESAPVLEMQCAVSGRPGQHPDLDAGDSVVLHCTVTNTGKGIAKVELETSIAGGAPTRSPAQSVAIGARAAFDVSLVVPRELAIDSTVEISATARDAEYARTARVSVLGVVRKPRLCAPGQLTRAQYQAKIRELRAAAAAGDITQAQLDRYDAELVTCLQ